MNKKILTELSDQELLQEEKRWKKSKTVFAVMLGLMMGIALYSTWNNGFGLLTFLPLFFIPIAIKNDKAHKDVLNELKKRNLNKV